MIMTSLPLSLSNDYDITSSFPCLMRRTNKMEHVFPHHLLLCCLTVYCSLCTAPHSSFSILFLHSSLPASVACSPSSTGHLSDIVWWSSCLRKTMKASITDVQRNPSVWIYTSTSPLTQGSQTQLLDDAHTCWFFLRYLLISGWFRPGSVALGDLSLTTLLLCTYAGSLNTLNQLHSVHTHFHWASFLPSHFSVLCVCKHKSPSDIHHVFVH